MEYVIPIAVIIVALVLVLFLQNRQLSQLTNTLNRKIEEDNHRTQDKIDQMNEAVNRKIDNNNARVQDSITLFLKSPNDSAQSLRLINMLSVLLTNSKHSRPFYKTQNNVASLANIILIPYLAMSCHQDRTNRNINSRMARLSTR